MYEKAEIRDSVRRQTDRTAPAKLAPVTAEAEAAVGGFGGPPAAEAAVHTAAAAFPAP